jgi:rhodanese-related sulfurtransferase/DNA-binding transcriptional ArsR family regulator
MTGREAKDALYAQFGRIARAVANPRRIELIELLAQAERSVEELAWATGMEIGNTSAQLQVLARAQLVDRRRQGKRILYRIADEGVVRFLVILRELARSRLAEVEQVARDYFGARDLLEPIGPSELMARIERGEAVVIDVRPAQEFAAGHIPGAISVPLDELRHRLGDLPQDAEVVAYCRGPYCVLAPQAVEILRQAGFRARRLRDGLPEWRLAGLPVEVGTTPRSE